MTPAVLPEMPPALVAWLRRGRAALLLTVGADGWATSTYTWAVALDATRLRVVADHGSRALANLERDGRASLVVVRPRGMNHLIKGRATPCAPRLQASDGVAAMALWEVAVDGVRDQSWQGVETSALAYRWPADVRGERRRMERAVFAEMRRA